MQKMRVIARVPNFACPNSFAAMTRNGMLVVGEVSELEHDMAHVLKGLRNGSLDPADAATAEKAGGKVVERWLSLQTEASKSVPAVVLSGAPATVAVEAEVASVADPAASKKGAR